MKLLAALVLVPAFSLAAASTSLAACPDMAGSGTTAKIAKNGTKAPLETPKNAPGVTSTASGTTTDNRAADAATSGKIQKNGQTMPLAGKQGGGDVNKAMSQQDVQAQQKGEKTAAAKSTACQD
ncbi:MAG: hypothetical protein ACTHJ3_11410 [Pararhizobium sp.]